MRFSHCFETDVALARWDAQREWRYWREVLRRLERKRASFRTVDNVRVWLTNAKAKCRRLREEMRS